MTADPDDFGYPPPPLFGGFSENDLVEQPAIDLFAELGWATGNLFGEFAHGASAARSTPFAPIPRSMR